VDEVRTRAHIPDFVEPVSRQYTSLTREGVVEIRARRDGREERVPADRAVDAILGLRAGPGTGRAPATG
jgi:hypothetical protein